MALNTPDSHKISLKIIEAIKQHPVLYVSEVKGNAIKLQEFRQKVWKRISDELNLDPGWVKLKWKNLRDTYCRILKYKNKSPKGVKRKKWLFEDQLSFLKFPYEPNYKSQCVELTEEYINDINTEVVSPQDLFDQLDDNEDEDYSEYLEVMKDPSSEVVETEEISCISSDNASINIENMITVQQISVDNHLQQISVDNHLQQIQSKFRKIRPKQAKFEENNIGSLTPIFINKTVTPVNNKPMLMQSSTAKRKIELPLQKKTYNHNNSIDQFFTGIAQTVKKLPPNVQADIKLEICRIVSEAETEHSHLHNMQKYSTMPGMIPKLVLIPCKMIDKN